MNLTYPEFERGSTSGHDKRLLQKAKGVRGVGSGWCIGVLRWRNDPVRGGAKHSRARDWRLELTGVFVADEDPPVDVVFVLIPAVAPGAGTTFGYPMKCKKHKLNKMYIFMENLVLHNS